MKVTLMIKKEFLSKRHIDENNKWVSGEDIDNQYWVCDDTDTFAIEECYFDNQKGAFVISVLTDGCYSYLSIPLEVWVKAARKCNLSKFLSKLIEETETLKATLEEASK